MLGDFNMDHSHRQLSAFVEHYNFYNLIKANIKCDGSYILIESIGLKIKVRLNLVLKNPKSYLQQL